MRKKEEITDLIRPEAFEDVNFKVGLILKFQKTTIKLTKVDRKNKRVWAEHINTYDFNNGMSHYGHDVNASDPTMVFCKDCQIEIGEKATEEGEIKAAHRQEVVDEVEMKEQRIKDKDRRFRYELLLQDGTIKHYPKQRRKSSNTLVKILHASELAVVPVAYYPQRYETAALYSDKAVNWDKSIRNPHLEVLPGDPEDGGPKEYFIVGDVLAEIEVK